MYESPLEKIYSNIQSQIIKQDEENMMYAVNQAVGYNVDKQELIKALNYDREQYKKGYADAMSVIENIKTEIEDFRNDALEYPNWEYAKGLDKALIIIDKHISGKEIK